GMGGDGAGGREHARRAGPPRPRRRGGRFSGRGAAALRRRPRCRADSNRPVLLTAVPEDSLYDVAVIGAGYVGVPLAATFAEAGSRVLLVDVQQRVVEALNRGESHIGDVGSERRGALT